MASQTKFQKYNVFKYNKRPYNFQTTSFTFLAFNENQSTSDSITKTINRLFEETENTSDILKKSVVKIFFEFQGMVDEEVQKSIFKLLSKTVSMGAWLTTRKNKGSNNFQGE